MFLIYFVISDIFGKMNIISNQSCSFQQNLTDKSRENGKKYIPCVIQYKLCDLMM